MKPRHPAYSLCLAIFAAVAPPHTAAAQGTVADYQRAMAMRERYQGLALNVAESATWIQMSHRFWYRRSVTGGSQFVLVDADSRETRPAFDHARLAATLTDAVKPDRAYTAVTLPFNTFALDEKERSLEFTIGAAGGPLQRGGQEVAWQCALDTYVCTKRERSGGRGGRGGGLAGPVRRETHVMNAAEPQKSPDEKFDALVLNYNVAIQEIGSRTTVLLSSDGSEGAYYDPESLVWSPDSRKIAIHKVRPGHRRFLHYIESSPEDQLQPKHSTMQYAKPGDVLDQEQPVIFDVNTKKQVAVDNALFPNAYDLSAFRWRNNSSALTFEYNERGHQVFRIIEVDAASGRARAVISEEPKTFFAYSSKKFRHDVADGREVIWMSERDGWNHLYLYDGTNGTVNGQITKGRWPVRSVVHVDDEKRQIWFSASGMYPGKDPYFTHYYRIDFDGSDLTALTEADANHTVVFSPDMSYYVDTYSRVDAPPVAELRRSSDRSLILALEKADITALMEAGWQPPDITRVGLYGNSAGGQNALGALLFFPDFYKAAVSSSGCHDNRMDKIWWNEQWMGWPIESQYAESSTSTTPTASG